MVIALAAACGPTTPNYVVLPATALLYPTLPPEWTHTPPAPTTQAPPQTSSATPAPDYEQRLAAAQTDIEQARALFDSSQWLAAIPVWDRVIAQVPEYAEAYYQRTRAYLHLAPELRVATEYLDYMALALADMNEALRLDPQNGDYYDERHYVYMKLAGMELYRVDQDYWWELAVADIKAAQRYGTTIDSTERDVAFTVLGAGHAEEALAMFSRIPPQDGTTLESDELLQIGLGESYLALGQFEQALTHIDRSLQLSPEEYKTRERAIVLHGLGRLPEAMDQLNQSINGNPHFCGCRYYLRAYLYYLQGQPDLAQADIEVGTGQTWERGGLRSYVLGLLALDRGDLETGAQLVQEAEASLARWYGPVLLTQIRQHLHELGFPRLGLEPYAPAVATAMPTPP